MHSGGRRKIRGSGVPRAPLPRVLGLAATLLGCVAGQAVGQSESPTDTSAMLCEAPRPLRLEGLSSPSDDFARIAEITGEAPSRSRLVRRGGELEGPLLCGQRLPGSWRARLLPRRFDGVRILPIRQRLALSSATPVDGNDGALWRGRGLSSELSAGVHVRGGVFSAAVAPALLYAQNRDFSTVALEQEGRSPFGHAWYRGIDLPQRFGDEARWSVDPGQSFLRIDAAGIGTGVSTENLWWGPGRRNSILMSNAGPGFPHAFLGTSRPVGIAIGRLEAQAVWGVLGESDFFDVDSDNDRRQFSGLVTAYEPRWLPGLYLGAARVFVYAGTEISLDRMLPFALGVLKEDLATPENPSGNDPANQLFSLYTRWVLPESGFEVYAEWAREDHSWNLDDFFQEPDHSQAYLLGFQKVVKADTRWVRLAGELTHLQERPVARQGRSTPVFYNHSVIRQGYTQGGQLLGAWIGPGADSQTLSVDILGERSTVGLTLERVRRNDSIFYTLLGASGFNHDVEGIAGVHQLIRWGGVDLLWNAGYSFRRNRNFADDSHNWLIDLTATWAP